MAMTDRERNEFESLIRDGDWHMNIANDKIRNHYFSDAKNHYWNAADCYKRAYNIARSANDWSHDYIASKKQMEAEREYRDVSYKEDAYVREKNRYER